MPTLRPPRLKTHAAKRRPAPRLSQVTGVRTGSYAECRKGGRFGDAGASAGPGTSLLSVHGAFDVLASTDSLNIRGGFRSHRQNTQRVDCVYTTRPKATHL